MVANTPLWDEEWLIQALRETPEFQHLADNPAPVLQFQGVVRQALAQISQAPDPDEPLTINLLIDPILAELGWAGTIAEQLVGTRSERVDKLLLPAEAAFDAALADEGVDRLRRGVGICECKRRTARLDGPGSGARPGETAHHQIQRYLLAANADSDGAIRWGMLANGAEWRIYSADVRPRDRFHPIDLAGLVAESDMFALDGGEQADRLRAAFLLLRRDSWTSAPGERESLLDRLLAEGRRNEQRVADDLSDAIFNNVFPELVEKLWSKQPHANPEDISRAALFFLYRLLVISYAEDGGLLPVDSDSYGPISLRRAVRDDVAARIASGAAFSANLVDLWERIDRLRLIIDEGDDALGIPPYNGGLFRRYDGVLNHVQLSDAELAPIINALSHADSKYIGYRSLSVQQLGGIYERLLERIPVREGLDGPVDVTIQPFARKDSGSYYTPQHLVDLIVEQTLRPLVDERIAAFEAGPSPERDPATAVLGLRVLDPAMGSGHFLVAALDWLAEEVSALLEREWECAPGHVSPIRAELDDAHARLAADGATVGDRAVIQRMVLKRCIYGVDKNVLAVELAQVALWLHTFVPPLPLADLSHRIICGDSLLGVWASDVRRYLSEWAADLTRRAFDQELKYIEQKGAGTGPLHQTLDLRRTEMPDYQDTALQDLGSDALGRISRPYRFTAGMRWQYAGLGKTAKAELHEPVVDAWGGLSKKGPKILLEGENHPFHTQSLPEYRDLRDDADALCDRENILHWELAFPYLWRDWAGDRRGGFDAVISNPPWDRIKLQEVEWWAARDDDLAKAPTAAERRRIIDQRRQASDPLVAQFDEAVERAQTMSLVVRESDNYPLMGKGDINLYSLFVERGLQLLSPGGIMGMLTPSGIYSDLTAADFFKSVSTTGRLSGVYDFENRRSANPDADTGKWFPDVHPQFKFCALIVGGEERKFEQANCGFYLNSRADLDDPQRVFPMTPADFQRINPNTGTMPTLRSPQGAEIVRGIYERHPVLVNRSGDAEHRIWPVSQMRMFDMTNDSNWFKTAEDLAGLGAYRVVGNHYKLGGQEWLPLYQGRMIHQFDHRAGSVEVHPENTHNPYVTRSATDQERQSPDFLPETQYWVDAEEVKRRTDGGFLWALGFRDIARATDERTIIATIVPFAAYGNPLPILLPVSGFAAPDAALLVGNLNSLCLDFIAKRKVQGTHANWYIVEQLPVIEPSTYDRAFGSTTAAELVRDHVLRLCCTATDLEPFARELGHAGQPFRWDAAERRQLRARLDALYLHLYGLSESDAEHVLGQFPVLEKNDRSEHGRYLTRDLVLGHYRALAQGDAAAQIS